MTIPKGWKLVPEEPTVEMLEALLKDQQQTSNIVSHYKKVIAAAPQPDPSVLRGTDRLTEGKASYIQELGYEVSGYILTNQDGKRCLIEKSVVRWLSNEAMWELMHPDQNYIFE